MVLIVIFCYLDFLYSLKNTLYKIWKMFYYCSGEYCLETSVEKADLHYELNNTLQNNKIPRILWKICHRAQQNNIAFYWYWYCFDNNLNQIGAVSVTASSNGTNLLSTKAPKKDYSMPNLPFFGANKVQIWKTF